MGHKINDRRKASREKQLRNADLLRGKSPGDAGIPASANTQTSRSNIVSKTPSQGNTPITDQVLRSGRIR